MRLRTYESFWILKNGLLHSYPCVKENLKCDIVVVGAGITGALVSHALRQNGYEVIVLDKHDVASGSTSATTSMLQYEIDEPLHKLQKKIGEDNANLCYLAGVEAIDTLKKLVQHEKLDCGFEMKDSLYMAHDQDAARDLKLEFLARKKIKLPVKWLSAREVKQKYGLKCSGAILSKKGACVDAYRLAHELFFKNSHAKKNPLRIFDQTEIKEVKETSKSVRIDLSNGKYIRCEHVVYCNGFEGTTLLKEKVADFFETYATISEPDVKLKPALKRTLIWDTREPYLYMRTTDDNRLLIGGEDSAIRMNFIREKMKKMKEKVLLKRLKEVASEYEFIEDFSWSGTFGKTKDGLPYIGKSPEYKRAFFVLGFGGNGITFSSQAMDIIISELKGEKTDLAWNYRFGR